MDELIEAVGSVDRSAALKALITWVDLGVLKEDTEDTFRLLEIAEEPSAEPRERRAGMFTFLHAQSHLLTLGIVAVTPEVPPVAGAQQQQAEKMRVYWKVRYVFPIRWLGKHIAMTVHRRDAYESRSASGRQNTIHAQNSPWVRSDNRAAWRVLGSSQERGTAYGTGWNMEAPSIETRMACDTECKCALVVIASLTSFILLRSLANTCTTCFWLCGYVQECHPSQDKRTEIAKATTLGIR